MYDRGNPLKRRYSLCKSRVNTPNTNLKIVTKILGSIVVGLNRTRE